MKFIDFLKFIDLGGLTCIIYINDEEDPIWIGKQSEIPYWLCDLTIAGSGYGDEPVSFRNSLGDDFNSQSGFVISLIEKTEKAGSFTF